MCLRLSDNQAFAGRFYDFFAYSVQLIDLGYTLDLSHAVRLLREDTELRLVECPPLEPQLNIHHSSFAAQKRDPRPRNALRQRSTGALYETFSHRKHDTPVVVLDPVLHPSRTCRRMHRGRRACMALRRRWISFAILVLPELEVPLSIITLALMFYSFSQAPNSRA